jgi:hypothetical protein
MASVAITVPLNNGDAFPATIVGTYSELAAATASKPGDPPPPPPPVVPIAVTIKNEGTGAEINDTANGTNGDWSLAKPVGLASGTYTITASLLGASDSKTGIVN